MTLPPAVLPVRLPDGWRPRGHIGEYTVAAPDHGSPRPLLMYTVAPNGERLPLPALAAALCADLSDRYEDLLVLDLADVRCRGRRPAVRVLSTHLTAGRSVTSEHWLIEGSGDGPGTTVHVLAAVVPTGRYADLLGVLHRAMRSFREPAS